MTRILMYLKGNSGELARRLNKFRDRLIGEGDEELTSKCIKGFDGANMDQEFRGFANRYFGIESASDFVIEGLAAKQILQERYGQEYILNLLGYRKPKTFLEKGRYLLTGNLPRKDR